MPRLLFATSTSTINRSAPSSLCMLPRFGLDRPYCGSASFQTNPRTSEKAKVPRNKRGETYKEVHRAVADQCVVCIKARDVEGGTNHAACTRYNIFNVP